MQLGHLEIDEASQARQKAGRCKTPKFHIACFFRLAACVNKNLSIINHLFVYQSLINVNH